MENLTPKISVLLPVRQWRNTTRQAVDSLLSQTIDNIEILLIGHQNVNELLTHLPNDPRIKPIVRQSAGIVGALNTGLTYAKAPYIARMDDDDIAHPTRLETQLTYLQTHPDIQLCATRIQFVNQSGSTQSIRNGNLEYAQWLNSVTEPQQIRQACFIECPMPHPTLMAHRNIWRSLGGYRQFDGPEDYDLILRAFLLGMNMGKPNEILLDWREHSERLTYNDPRYRREAFTQLRAWAAAQPESGLKLESGRPIWLCGTGKNARHWHDALEALGMHVQGFVDIQHDTANRQKRSKPIINYQELSQQRSNSLVITALSQPAARLKLLAYFKHQNWKINRDFILGG